MLLQPQLPRAVLPKPGEVFTRALVEKDGELALKAIARLDRQLELKARLLGELEDRGGAGVTRVEVVYVDEAIIAVDNRRVPNERPFMRRCRALRLTAIVLRRKPARVRAAGDVNRMRHPLV